MTELEKYYKEGMKVLSDDPEVKKALDEIATLPFVNMVHEMIEAALFSIATDRTETVSYQVKSLACAIAQLHDYTCDPLKDRCGKLESLFAQKEA
jgi:hypothetical protein